MVVQNEFLCEGRDYLNIVKGEVKNRRVSSLR